MRDSAAMDLLKMKATKYIQNMNLPDDKQSLLMTLAHRYDSQTFLKSYGDIRALCWAVGIEEPVKKTRHGSVSYIFDALANQEPNYLQNIIDGLYFSGPSRLSVISDAIKNYDKSYRQKN